MDAVKAYTVLAELYPSPKLSDEGARLWIQAVKEIPEPLIEKAVVEYMRLGSNNDKGDFFPTPSVLRKLALNAANLQKDFTAYTPPDSMAPFLQASAKFRRALFALEDNYYKFGILDREGWEMLLDTIDENHPELKAHIKTKLANLEGLAVKTNMEVM